MRIFLALIICITFIGGLTLYMSHRAGAVKAPLQVITPSELHGQYSLEITTTFTVEPDPFAIQTDEAEQAPALLVRLGNQQILRKTDRLEAGASIRVKPLTGMVSGDNEIYFEANPPLDAADKSHAVRVRILESGYSIADRTFWSEPGGKVSDILRFTLSSNDKEEETHAH